MLQIEEKICTLFPICFQKKKGGKGKDGVGWSERRWRERKRWRKTCFLFSFFEGVEGEG